MIVVDKTLVSDDIARIRFVCDLKKCHGACCVEGDAGAPLEDEEVGPIEDYLPYIEPYMTPGGRKTVKENGVIDYDMHGNIVTPLVNDKECAFVYFEENIARCAIEKAFQEKKIPFAKPVSCHLYPVRINKLSNGEGVNYHRWHICEKALTNGKRKNIYLFQFLKDSLIRYFGAKWYAVLLKEIKKSKY